MQWGLQLQQCSRWQYASLLLLKKLRETEIMSDGDDFNSHLYFFVFVSTHVNEGHNKRIATCSSEDKNGVCLQTAKLGHLMNTCV